MQQSYDFDPPANHMDFPSPPSQLLTPEIGGEGLPGVGFAKVNHSYPGTPYDNNLDGSPYTHPLTANLANYHLDDSSPWTIKLQDPLLTFSGANFVNNDDVSPYETFGTHGQNTWAHPFNDLSLNHFDSNAQATTNPQVAFDRPHVPLPNDDMEVWNPNVSPPMPGSMFNLIDDQSLSLAPSIAGFQDPDPFLGGPVTNNLQQSIPLPVIPTPVVSVNQAPTTGPIHCTWQGCTTTFQRDADRLRHVQAIHQRAGHLCPVAGCVKSTGQGYSRADKVKEHLWKKHANLGYTKRT